jgi:ABC transporter substrate binding protein
MRRREFIGLVGGAMAWPLAARAQQPGRVPVIGFLGASWASASGEGQRLTSFVERLRDLGWIEGRTVAIEYRWADGRAERFTEIASEFVQLKVDIIVTYATPAVIAVKQVTSVIPIVFAGASDPVGTGLVTNLARPGGNATGVSLQTTDIVGKRLEFLREIVPDLRRLAIMAHPASLSPWANSRVRGGVSPGDHRVRKPTTCMRCCARAVTGHTAALPSRVMNWRRLMPSMGFLWAGLYGSGVQPARLNDSIPTLRRQSAAPRNFVRLDR